jgi:hypothetical protein
MRYLALAILVVFIAVSTLVGTAHQPAADDPWDLWSSGSTKLWGANIYQVVDKDTKQLVAEPRAARFR